MTVTIFAISVSNSFSHILILFIFFFHSLFLQFHSFPPVFTQFLFLALSYLYSSLHQIQIFFSLSSLSYYFSEMLQAQEAIRVSQFLRRSPHEFALFFIVLNSLVFLHCMSLPILHKVKRSFLFIYFILYSSFLGPLLLAICLIFSSFIYPFLHFPLSLSFFVPLYLFIPFLSFLLSLASNELNLCTHPFHHHCVLFPPVSCY